MNALEIRSIIKIAAAACMSKNAEAFAALFSPNGEIILPGDRIVGKAEIEQVTAKYLSTCKSINIQIKRILVDGDQAVVEWSWSDIKTSGSVTRADNAIIIDFKASLITRWREYTDIKTKPDTLD